MWVESEELAFAVQDGILAFVFLAIFMRVFRRRAGVVASLGGTGVWGAQVCRTLERVVRALYGIAWVGRGPSVM